MTNRFQKYTCNIIALIFMGVIVYAMFPTNIQAKLYTPILQRDSNIKNSAIDTTNAIVDSLIAKGVDSSKIMNDSTMRYYLDSATTKNDTVVKVQPDSVNIADSLSINKNLLDSITMAKLIELKKQGEDTLILLMYDSLQTVHNNTLPPLDSLHLQELAFPPKVYTKRELKRMEREKRMNFKDSVIRSKPRFLSSYLFSDSTQYQRHIVWNEDSYFNNPKRIEVDTSFNYYYSELPADRNDVNAVSLGVSGSAMMYYNYFKRDEDYIFPFISPYLPYFYTPETIPFINTKTPFTELAYWGTLFANKKKEESNVKFNHSQNFTPSFNYNIMYQRYGGRGILLNEATDNRTFAFTMNYLGERYVAQGGYIYNKVGRNENGGVSDLGMVLDTIIDPRTIPVYLNKAETIIKKNTFFITHSYGVPFNIFGKKDSLGRRIKDTLGLDKGTVTFFGHTGEFTTYKKSYTDEISLSDELARTFYNNKFYINPTNSADSVRVLKLENRVFISLQPWKRDAIVSRLDGGVAFQYLTFYNFRPEYFLSGNKSSVQNNVYAYFGASGQFKKYFSWEAFGKYNFIGYNTNDFLVDGKIKFAAYPKRHKEGLHLHGRIFISNSRPNEFFNNYYSNHYVWNNDFKKVTETKVEARLNIPKWKMEAFFGYSLLNNNIYFNEEAIVTQNTTPMSILTAYLQKNFKLWKFHFNNKILFQTTTNETVMPLPLLALNLRYFLEFDVKKDVMTLQVGANATFNTKYYTPGYSPALGLFYNQRTTKIGENPYIDVFANFQWKRACIFVKYINAAQHWPTNDYFSADRYLRPAKAFKIGIYWPFYL